MGGFSLFNFCMYMNASVQDIFTIYRMPFAIFSLYHKFQNKIFFLRKYQSDMSGDYTCKSRNNDSLLRSVLIWDWPTFRKSYECCTSQTTTTIWLYLQSWGVWDTTRDQSPYNFDWTLIIDRIHVAKIYSCTVKYWYIPRG